MENFTLKTVAQIAEYVKPLIDTYRKFPAQEQRILQKLKVVFDMESNCLSTVVKDNRFSEAFFRKMGKGRMRALKKILLVLNEQYYKNIDFKED